MIQVNLSALADMRPMHEIITIFQEHKVSNDKIKKENQLKEEKRSISPGLTFKTRYLSHKPDVTQSEKTTTLNFQPI